MTKRKDRLTVSVDPDLIEAANTAVSSGLAGSLSAWVNGAMSDRAVKERRLEWLSAAIADYEAEFGEISLKEMGERARADRETARVVRGSASNPGRHRTSRPASPSR